MGRAVLSINANKSMNLVLMNILNKDFDFFCAEDVYSGFNILKSIKEIEMIVILQYLFSKEIQQSHVHHLVSNNFHFILDQMFLRRFTRLMI